MRVAKALILLIYGIFCGCLIAFSFVENFFFTNWSELLPDEIIYHLKNDMNGTDSGIVIKGLLTHGSMIIISIVLLVFLHFYLKNNKKAFKYIICLTLSFSIFMGATSLYDANEKSGIIEYTQSVLQLEDGSDFISDNYVDPYGVNLTFPDKKKNLIYIYLESSEITFADKKSGGAFDYNCIPDFTKILTENENFSGNENRLNGAYSLPGTNWTAAGMFSEISGLPIKVSLMDNSFMDGSSFLPEIYTLGDILKDNGYSNTILMGSDIKFGGRDYLFSEHGSYQVHDYNYAKDSGLIPKDYHVFWGYEDKKLFEFAKKDLLEISKKDEPFNYTILTVDTHFPYGYYCEDCTEDFPGNQYANVYACSGRRINSFLEWLKTTDFYEDTVVVLAGDHTTMDSEFCKDIDKEYIRKIIFAVVNSDEERKTDNYREYSVFDIFPTTLASLGVNISGNRLGLGVNLYSKLPTIAETIGYHDLKKNMELPSNFFKKMGGDIDINDMISAIREKVALEIQDYEGNCFIVINNVSFFNPSLIDNARVVVKVEGENKEREYDLAIGKHERNSNQIGFMAVLTDIEYMQDKKISVKGYISYDGNEELLFLDSGYIKAGAVDE